MFNLLEQEKQYLNILKENKSFQKIVVTEKFSEKNYLTKLSPVQAKNFLGKYYGTTVKSLEMALSQSAKKLSNKSFKFSVTEHFLLLGGMGESAGIAIHGQVTFSGGKGALKRSALIPIKFGNFKMRPEETVGDI